MTPVVLTFAVAFLSSVTQIVTGFGFAVVMMALLPLFLPYDTALCLSILCGCILSLWLVVKYRRQLQWKKAVLPALFSILGSLVGLLLDAGGGSRRLLGMFLVLLALWFLLFAKRVQVPGTLPVGAAVGVVAGVCNALFAMCGPPMVLYYVSVIREKEAYISTLNLALAGASVFTLALRAAMVGWPAGLEVSLLPCAAAMVTGAWVGKLVFDRVDAQQMKRIIYIFMCVVGVYFAIAG